MKLEKEEVSILLPKLSPPYFYTGEFRIPKPKEHFLNGICQSLTTGDLYPSIYVCFKNDRNLQMHHIILKVVTEVTEHKFN